MAADDAISAGATDPGILHKVRSLLAKAESTTFPEEAEALTAKAQQLMDRHAIDRAVLAASAPPGSSVPEGRRLVVDAPYARERFQLLSEVAMANRCRAVWSKHAGFATVIGFPDDQETVELLYTSLLVQATTTMLARGDTAEARTKTYRLSFLIAYAVRIGQRLRAASAATVAAADRDHGGAVLPVLASREVAINDLLAEKFPETRTMRVQARDRAGYQAGLSAADRADLGDGAAIHRRSPRTRGRRGLRRGG